MGCGLGICPSPGQGRGLLRRRGAASQWEWVKEKKSLQAQVRRERPPGARRQDGPPQVSGWKEAPESERDKVSGQAKVGEHRATKGVAQRWGLGRTHGRQARGGGVAPSASVPALAEV